MKYDIIIAGSGISGMSLAYHCARENMKILVVEKNPEIGGSFTTEYFDDFWLELGAHTMYNSYGNLIAIIEGCKMKADMIARKKVPYKALNGDNIKSIISQFSILELLISLPSLFRIKKDNQTVESYYSRIVGRRNYRKFFQYMFNAVPSQPTNEFPANILFKKRQRRKDILKSYTFTNGIKSIIDAISALPEIEIISTMGVSEVKKSGDVFEVMLDDKSTYNSEYLALATPLPVTAQLLSNVHPALAEEFKKIQYVHTDTVGVVLKKKNVEIKEVAGIIGIDSDLYSMVSRDVVADDKYRGFVFHFKPGKLDNTSKIRFICRLLKIKEEDLEHIFYKRNLVPSFKLGHDLITEEIDRMLNHEKILVTGNYFSGMAIEDCVGRSVDEFKRLQKFKT